MAQPTTSTAAAGPQPSGAAARMPTRDAQLRALAAMTPAQRPAALMTRAPRSIDSTALTAVIIDVGRGRHRLLTSGVTPQSVAICEDALDDLQAACAAIYAKEPSHLLGPRITAHPGPARQVIVA